MNYLDKYLVWDWRQSWKWLSMQITSLMLFAQLVYDLIPSLSGIVSDSTLHYLTIGGLVLVLLGRLKKQDV